MKDFLSRLEFLADGRSYHAWLTGTAGWSKGMVAAARKGHVPGPESLQALVDTDSVNLNWLLTGAGAPFEVAHVLDDEDALEVLEHHTEVGIWKVRLYQTKSVTVLLFIDRKDSAPGEAQSFWRTRTFAGHFRVSGALEMRLFRRIEPAAEPITETEARQLAAGWLAPRKLVERHPPEVHRYLFEGATTRIGESPAPGRVDSTHEARMRVIDYARQLRHSDLLLIEQLGKRLAEDAPKKR